MKHLIIFLFLLLNTFSFAQTSFCGTPSPPDYLQNIPLGQMKAASTNNTLRIAEDKITVTVLNQPCQKLNEIILINPNPATDNILVRYKVTNGNTAKLRLIKTDYSIDREYIINIHDQQVPINVSDCSFGNYIILLECDGNVEDSKPLIIH